MGGSLRFWQGVLSFGRCWFALPPRHPRGAWWFWLPADSAFSLLFCPLFPRPPSPVGKGVTKVISCKGLRPLHPRGLNPGGTYNPSKNRYPAGGVPFFSPANPAFGLLFCPLSPRPPSPAGKGVTKVISCKGLRPLHPRGLNPWFAAKPTGIGSLRVVPPCTCSGGVCKCRKRFSAGVPGAKPPAK